jgi:lysophospholipase L1-like esterase
LGKQIHYLLFKTKKLPNLKVSGMKSRIIINNTFFKAFYPTFPIIAAFCILLSSSVLSAGSGTDSTKWIGTWATAPQLVEPGNVPSAPGLNNNSLRQIVRVSIGGDSLRLKFSNKFSTSLVTMKSVQIAVSAGGSTIVDFTNKELTFNGIKEVTMDSAVEVTSDPFFFKLEPRMTVAITIYFGQTSSDVTGHPGSRTTSYLLTGNTTSITDFSGSIETDHWYIINGIDVKAPLTATAVAILGNSITDGRGSTPNLQNRWPDKLSEALLNNPGKKQIAVLNMGIGANCVLSGGNGPTGVKRFEHDILSPTGVRSAIIFEGVNDIGGVKNAEASAIISNNLITAYKQMIIDAHHKNIWIYGATILPFKGNANYFNNYSENCRNIVNNWIRTSGCFDAVIDFDKALRNPLDTASLGVSSYQNDFLHPDTSGYQLMVKAIDLKLFEGLDTLMPGIGSKGLK